MKRFDELLKTHIAARRLGEGRSELVRSFDAADQGVRSSASSWAADEVACSTVSIIVSMFLPFLLWGSLVALLLARNRVLYERAQSAPAAQKAEALIREWLSSSQLYDYERRNKFEVTGSAGGRYLIARGYIRDLDTGQDICFVPENWTVF